jgi:hypothetical protein
MDDMEGLLDWITLGRTGVECDEADDSFFPGLDRRGSGQDLAAERDLSIEFTRVSHTVVLCTCYRLGYKKSSSFKYM